MHRVLLSASRAVEHRERHVNAACPTRLSLRLTGDAPTQSKCSPYSTAAAQRPQSFKPMAHRAEQTKNVEGRVHLRNLVAKIRNSRVRRDARERLVYLSVFPKILSRVRFFSGNKQ